MSELNRDAQDYLEALGFNPFAWVNEPTIEPAGRVVDGDHQWNDLRLTCGSCAGCKLSATRMKVVFGGGSVSARLMFVGEAPGLEDDREGEPFSGQSGQLLTKMIEAMKLSRSDVFITNVVKCLPPNNRNPEADEIAACASYLSRQIEWVGPEVIVALGSVAAKTLLSSEAPISKLRGQFHTLEQYSAKNGKKVSLMPTFHPAYLLRNPEMKMPAWQDLKLVMARLGLN